MAIASNFPAIKPSLSLDFANTKKLDPRVTFTRTTTATYYDGVTTAMAEQNLLLQSQALSTSPWILGQITVEDNTGDTTAPDGTSTAEKLTDTVANNFHACRQTINVLANTDYAVSVFLKKGTSNFGTVALADSGTAQRYFSADFNLDTGAVRVSGAGTSGTLTSTSITSVGNGWYRCTLVGQLSVVSANIRVVVGVSDGTTAIGTFGLIIYTGTGSTIYAWGAQLEQRSSVTSYTATTTQAITNYIPVLLTAASGVARFQHNPTTDESLGLLIEEARTNLALRSDDFANATWVKAASSITSNTIVAPDGTLTGDKLVEDTTNANHTVRQPITVTSGTTYTFSCFIKAGERTECAVEIFTGATVYRAVFNLLTGAFISSTGTGSYNVSSVGNGWFRISITAAASTTTLNPFIYTSSGGTTTYTGNGYNGIYIWGAQLEAGAFPTSYIPTVAATVTRNADAANMTGSNFTSWFNAAEGTLYAEYSTFSPTTNGYPFAIDNGSANNFISIRTLASGGNALRSINITSSGSGQTSVTFGILPLNTFTKGALAYKFNDIAATYDAVSAVTDTSANIPVVNFARIGNLTNSLFMSGRIRKLAYYPLRVTNAQLQALTS